MQKKLHWPTLGLATLLLFLTACTSDPVNFTQHDHTAPTMTGGQASIHARPRPQLSVRSRIILAAQAQIGVAYHLGGKDPDGFDCSGLVNYTYQKAGLTVPTYTADLYKSGQHITPNALQPGDLVFYKFPAMKREETEHMHVGIYVGNHQMIHAPRTGSAVRQEATNKPYWEQHYFGAIDLVPEAHGLNVASR